jgi:hypothetical protein
MMSLVIQSLKYSLVGVVTPYYDLTGTLAVVRIQKERTSPEGTD